MFEMNRKNEFTAEEYYEVMINKLIISLLYIQIYLFNYLYINILIYNICSPATNRNRAL